MQAFWGYMLLFVGVLIGVTISAGLSANDDLEAAQSDADYYEALSQQYRQRLEEAGIEP